jgi:hypothetical protein
MTVGAYVIYKFTCGHVGRDNEGRYAKATGFIRVAEARRSPVEHSDRNCPDCKGR